MNADNNTPDQPAPDPVLTKLLEASKEAKAVSKEGENKRQDYKYARAEDVIAEAHRALHAAGLVAVVEYGVASEREVASSGGSAGLLVRVDATLRVFDPESGRALTIVGTGSGIDYPGDKAGYKAQTGAAKYLFSSVLGIPFADDPERDAAEPRTTGSRPAPRTDVGYRDAGQRARLEVALEGAGVHLSAPAVLERVAQILTAAQIENAIAQLKTGGTQARARAKLLELAGEAPFDPEAPDTRDLPDEDVVQGELVGDAIDPGGNYFDAEAEGDR